MRSTGGIPVSSGPGGCQTPVFRSDGLVNSMESTPGFTKSDEGQSRLPLGAWFKLNEVRTNS